MFRTNRKHVPVVEGLKRDDGWNDMQVQFLIDKKSAGVDNVVGWTAIKPGASHDRHLVAVSSALRSYQPLNLRNRRRDGNNIQRFRAGYTESLQTLTDVKN